MKLEELKKSLDAIDSRVREMNELLRQIKRALGGVGCEGQVLEFGIEHEVMMLAESLASVKRLIEEGRIEA